MSSGSNSESNSEFSSLIQWRVNNGFLFECDSGGLSELINTVPCEHRIFTCRFWWCPMNQCLLRLMIYPDNPTRLEPTPEGAERIRDNIYHIYKQITQKITDPEKKCVIYTALAAIFPCVIEDTTGGRFVITVSVDHKGLANDDELPAVWVTIHDRITASTQTHNY